MSYDPKGQAIALVKKAIWGTIDFNGRSQRTELIYYYITTMVLSFPVSFLFLPNITDKGNLTFPWPSYVISVLLFLPVPAMFCRRFHDQGRSGWFALPLLVLWLVPNFISNEAIHQTMTSNLMKYGMSLLGLMGFVVLMWKGSEGSNKFGPDPRLSEEQRVL